jgi:sugar transferase EpsL
MYRLYVKRSLDMFAAFVLLTATWPVLLLLFCLIRISLGRPVLFRQLRPGLKGKPFTMYKFRTMTGECDMNGELLPGERRLTRVGKYVRMWSLDELPELFNVLKGDLSFVGPRPLLVQYLKRYTPEQARRHDAMPGITGWAQINGRNALTWEEKFALDVWYVDHQSLMLDAYVLLMTAWKVVRREGIDQPGHVSAAEFMGSQDPTSTHLKG